MTKKVDENYFYGKEEEDEVKEKDRKCPPQHVPWLNPNEESTSHKPEERISAARSKDDAYEPGIKLREDKNDAKVVTQKHEAVAKEEAVRFDEKEMIKGRTDVSNLKKLWATDGHILASNPNKLWASNDDRNSAHGAFGGQPDDSLGAEVLDIQGQHCPNVTKERRSRPQEFIPPGAFPEGGPDIEEGGPDIEEGYEEDDFEEQAPVVTHEKLIDPISAELVDTEEEERHLQEKINQALKMERQLAVVAEVTPANDRRRKLFVIGVMLLIVAAVTTTLASMLTQKQLPSAQLPTSNCGTDGYFGPVPNCDLYYPNCSVDYPAYIGNGVCDYLYNTEECGWEGGDCVPCDYGYFGPNCTLHYPDCTAPFPKTIGNGVCEYLSNTEKCGWEGGDCTPCNDGYFGRFCGLHYPNCSVAFPEYIGDGICENRYNTTECGWEGGDCLLCDYGYFGPSCNITGYPNCFVPNSKWIGDGECDGGPYNTEECRWDSGDCVPCDDGYVGPNCGLHYPNCSVPIPNRIGDGACNGEPYNTEECGWDGGDCCLPGLVGPYCNITSNPDCKVPNPQWIADGVCDGEPYNMEECEWDGGDCILCNDGYVGPNCDLYFPNCSVPIPNWIGDAECDDEPYNTTECGWDGGDCV